jgi:hypothetical protein
MSSKETPSSFHGESSHEVVQLPADFDLSRFAADPKYKDLVIAQLGGDARAVNAAVYDLSEQKVRAQGGGLG